MASNPNPQPTVKSAMRTLDLIEYVVAHPDGLVAQEIASALAIPVSSLSYLLATLVERGYLRRSGRRYHAGPGLDRLRVPNAERSLAERAAPLIKALRLKLNETASLFEPKGWEMEAVATETAGQTLRYSIDIGTRVPLHCVAAGKALLAAAQPEELQRYFDGSERVRFTPHTLCDRQELLDELAVVRARGFARTRDEYTIGISGIGAAVCHGDGPIASIGVAVPSPRFTPEVEAQVVEQVLKTREAMRSA